MSSDALLVARDVTVTYHPTPRWLRAFIKSAVQAPVHAVQGVDLTLHRGEIIAVVGPNGAGKSTLFRSLMGLLEPSDGHVEVLGSPIVGAPSVLRRQISFMPPDDRTLFLRQTAMQNMLFRGHLLGLRGTELGQQARDALGVVGIAEASDRAVAALSTGMRFRLMLARALLGGPQILILDEPTGPLDPVAAHDFIGMLVNLVHERGIGAIVSSHRMDDVEAMPQRLVLLDRGRVRFDGPVAALQGSWHEHTVVITTHDEDTASALAESLAVAPGTSAEALGPSVHVISSLTIGELLGSVPRTHAIVDVQRLRPSLREALARVVREQTS